MRTNNHRWLEQTLALPEGSYILKALLCATACGIRQNPCIITMQHWHIQDMLTQQYSSVGKVAIMPTHWQAWQKHDLEELLTGALGTAVGMPWHL